MVREVIRPQKNSLTINIPNNYIDREIDFIMFPVDSADNKEAKPKKIINYDLTNSLFGVLKNSNLTEKDYKSYLEEKYL